VEQRTVDYQKVKSDCAQRSSHMKAWFIEGENKGGYLGEKRGRDSDDGRNDARGRETFQETTLVSPLKGGGYYTRGGGILERTADRKTRRRCGGAEISSLCALILTSQGQDE